LSKFGIFILSFIAGSVVMLLTFKKGRENMNAAVMERTALKCAVIDLMRDEEVNVWIATSEDVPGLVLESESLNILKQRVKLAAPELLELNSIDFDDDLLMNFREVELVCI
jgi:hypothetical protein